jgi:BirA family biotin operon repressor/biotin-[acetyl-CoA-carboxylase] ligase
MKYELIKLLADGKFHSGEELGEKLQLTRGAIWKIMQHLSSYGLEICRVKGKGYQVLNGLELLSNIEINKYLEASVKSNLTEIEILHQIDSTNQYLLDAIKIGKPSGSVALAEYQTAGRGRRGKSWFSPFGANLYLSILWHFNNDPSELSGLSLAVAVAIANALKKSGVAGIQVKWPNDILWNYRKLAGILIESIAESHSKTYIVIGVGINISMTRKGSAIDQDWVDIFEILQQKPQRNRITAEVINELVKMLMVFAQDGFKSFMNEWQVLDAYFNKPVILYTPTQQFIGTERGISSHGELILMDEHGKKNYFLHGSLRASVN